MAALETIQRQALWESILGTETEFKDPRFETDPVTLTVIIGENFQKAVAAVVLGRRNDADLYFKRLNLAIKSKIYNEESADYTDLIFWLLWAWILEEERDRPRLDSVMLAKHRQIVDDIRQQGNGEIAGWYQQIMKSLNIGMRSGLSPRHRGRIKDEKPYISFAIRLIEMARIWTWNEYFKDSSPLQGMLETAFLSIGQGNGLLVDRLGLKREDINFSRLVDLDLLRKAHPEKYPQYKEFIGWEQGRLKFFYNHCRILSAVARIIEEPSGMPAVKEADEALEEMFAEVRSSEGLDIIEQIQWARIGGTFALSEYSKKPLNVVRHYLGGV